MTQSESKPPISIKMKIGELEFEIQCQEDQVQPTVDKILSTVTDKLKGTQIISERTSPTPRAETCKNIIQKLWVEGWFSTARGLNDVHNEMARKGYHYDRTAVAHALMDLVKENVLTREGPPRRYQYAQKRPP